MWTHTVCPLLRLIAFTEQNDLEVHPCCRVYYSFILMLRIPLYGYTAICLTIHLLIDVWIVTTF